ncbi:hypothetical protein [Spirosoma flavum]|uniref:Uncharacterized protein n=1 Tax=Spirosoma flavum TaxID=2048557 RepID=A0ABW6AQ70_9BACT
MTSDAFNQLFDAYRQQAIETNVAAITPSSVGDKPTWVQILQQHVQEWKQHYKLESQAIEQVRDTYQRIHQAGPLSLTEQQAIQDDEERESTAVAMSFQVKRELIWARQQQELSTGKVIV